MRFKASSALLQLDDTERKLANLQEFKQAEEVSSRARKLRKKEEAAFERSKSFVDERPRKTCRDAQEMEMRNLGQKCHSLRVAVRREREQALEVRT